MQMNAIVEMLNAKKRAMMLQAKLLESGQRIKPKYEYDSDEETEGGTWEHKQRRAEMMATTGMLQSQLLQKFQVNFENLHESNWSLSRYCHMNVSQLIRLSRLAPFGKHPLGSFMHLI